MTPGIHPQRVRIKTRRMAPQPRSRTASGGKMMQMMALKSPMTKKEKIKSKKNRDTRYLMLFYYPK